MIFPSNCTAKDYYPFGMGMPGRTWQFGDEDYRYGFNGQEKVDEVYGNGNLNTALFWEYDTRLGRRWNVDPVVSPYESPYATFECNPIYFTDINGDTEDGPGGRKAQKRANKEIKKLESQGQAAWINDKVDNDGVWNIEFTTQESYVEEYGTGGIVINTLDVELTLGNKISNWFSGGDAWVHSDAGEQFGQEVAGFNPAIELINVGSGIATGNNIFNEEMTGVDYTFAALAIIPGGGELKGLKLAAKYRKFAQISKVAPDWAVKGAHVSIDGVEIALKPGNDGTIILKSVFSNTSVHSYTEAAKKIEILLQDPKFRKELMQKTSGAIDMFKSGSQLERNTAGELNFLLKALEKY